jgi:hypothetical protein
MLPDRARVYLSWMGRCPAGQLPILIGCGQSRLDNVQMEQNKAAMARALHLAALLPLALAGLLVRCQ